MVKTCILCVNVLVCSILCFRLNLLDVNQPAKNDLAEDKEFCMTLPQSSYYKDLHDGMVNTFPTLTVARVGDYLDQFDKKLDEKRKAMYRER